MNERSAHLPSWTLDLLAEGALSHVERTEAEAHLRGCERCSTELEAARAVLRGLEALPRFAPSAGFADRVMARVRIAPAVQAVPSRVRRWLPKTRRGWMMLGAGIAAPGLALLAFVLWLAAYPLTTLPALASVAASQAGDAVQDLLVGAAGTLAVSGLFASASDMLDAMLTTPAGGTTAALLAAAAAIPLSGWAMFRLLRTPLGATHAH